jgi:cytochrome c553
MIESRFSIRLAGALAILAATTLCFASAHAEEAATPEAKPIVGDAKAGAAKANQCFACHGENGTSPVAEQPNLAGQNEAYIVAQLKMFKAKHRNNPVMQSFVDPLSEQDMADIGAYSAAQTPTGLEADRDYWKAGEALYRSGDLARGIPACTSCHGPAAQGNAGAGYPALRAQHMAYTTKQLQDYLTQNRYRDAGNPAVVHNTPNSAMMTTIAARLTPEDIRNLATYVQGLR